MHQLGKDGVERISRVCGSRSQQTANSACRTPNLPPVQLVLCSAFELFELNGRKVGKVHAAWSPQSGLLGYIRYAPVPTAARARAVSPSPHRDPADHQHDAH